MSFTTFVQKAAPLASSTLALGLMLVVTSASQSAAGELLKSGQFVGQSDHVTTGAVTIEKEGDRTLVILQDDFSLDGAPAPTLGFSKGEKFDKSTEFAKLKSKTGRQVYEVPRGVLVSAYDTFTIWCSKFSVPLGSAALK